MPSQLGSAEYSYRFVLEGFRGVLERLGEVIEIADPHAEVPRLYADAVLVHRDCLLLCFCPPNLAPVGTDCPTSVVLAWEFDSIPDQAWNGDARNDWRTVLRDHGQAITLSTHSRDTIERTIPGDCKVSAIPVPVYETFADLYEQRARMARRSGDLSFSGRVIDSHTLDLASGRAYPTDTLSMGMSAWDGSPIKMTFDDSAETAMYLLGFYEPEPWGTWSRVVEPAILLPFTISGQVTIALELTAYGPNVGREIEIGIGRERRKIVLTLHPSIHVLSVDIREPVSLITLGKLDTSPVEGAVDIRTLGVGLVSLALSLEKKKRWVFPWFKTKVRQPKAQVALSGVVFTSVLNPQDGRKNWVDILTAFCFALGDRPDATLVFKMTHFSVTSFLADLLRKLDEIGPIRARVLALHGFLTDSQYRQLISGTSWYVNASHAEGLCLPLMEFMSAGVPAIAPNHTAMADYVDERSTLVVRSSRTPTRWPNDPLHRLRTRYYRIDWESLAGCFSQAYSIANESPDRYAAMSAAAHDAQQKYASQERVMKLLKAHLELVT